jgi:hypothetical protein
VGERRERGRNPYFPIGGSVATGAFDRMPMPPLAPTTILVRTAKGEDEIAHRSHRLPTTLRMVLLMIDGRRDLRALQVLNDRLRTSLEPLLELEREGYIERTEPD